MSWCRVSRWKIIRRYLPCHLEQRNVQESCLSVQDKSHVITLINLICVLSSAFLLGVVEKKIKQNKTKKKENTKKKTRTTKATENKKNTVISTANQIKGIHLTLSAPREKIIYFLFTVLLLNRISRPWK